MSVKYDLVSRDFKMGRAEHNLATKQKTEKEEENQPAHDSTPLVLTTHSQQRQLNFRHELSLPLKNLHILKSQKNLEVSMVYRSNKFSVHGTATSIG